MKIRLFTIPNILTLANLVCGALAVCGIFTTKDYRLAFMLIILAAVFDFFDGFVARFLNQNSPLGVELDSLADMVSFGLAPAVIMMSLFAQSETTILSPILSKYGYYIPLVIAAFSALRLAKFNIDENQTSEFIGLPTPACALFCAALGLLHAEGYHIAAEWVIVISIVLALLLISPIRMFALKFKGFGWRGNAIRYSFLIASAAIFIALQLDAIAPIILLYILISIVLHFAVCKTAK